MTSPIEFDDFLAELDGRRARLLKLVDPNDPSRTALIDELTELGEQLIVADEELRVQQEELNAARERLQSLVHQRELLLESSVNPYVLTDSRGVVLNSNRAAAELLRLPAIRRTPRPIATWFEVGDRAEVRGLISRINTGQAAEASARVIVRRADRSTIPVQVTVRAVDAGPGRTELQWEFVLEPPADAPRSLRLVSGSARPAATTDRELVTVLTALAGELAGCATEKQLLATVLERSHALVPGTRHAGVSLRRRAAVIAAAGTGELATSCDRLQLELGEGPAVAALAERSVVLVTDVATDARWPRFCAEATALGVGSMLAVGLGTGERSLGALTLYADRPGVFDDTSEFAASILAAHVGIALTRLRTEENLRAGLASREVIGEAVGILIERRRITSEQAFQLLVRASQHSNIKLREVAQIVVQTGQDPAQIRSR